MLVLTRKSGESIKIGEDIDITIIKVEGGQVKLGIAAPKNVTIYRTEVYERIMEENRRAALAQKEDAQKLSKLWRSRDRRDET